MLWYGRVISKISRAVSDTRFVLVRSLPVWRLMTHESEASSPPPTLADDTFEE